MEKLMAGIFRSTLEPRNVDYLKFGHLAILLDTFCRNGMVLTTPLKCGHFANLETGHFVASQLALYNTKSPL